jgi:hypothetical protein
MSRRSALAAEMVPIEKVLISNYVQLCLAEGLKPKDAYKELKKRLSAVKKLKDPKMLQ